jgi:alkanesulfonate monooxygenase SsuD/methylene tetrahydromethanopterin reductase-like flavin-dependent oxidoreductase (luciferase family)
MMENMRAVSAIGSPATVREKIDRFIERTQTDELIIAGSIWDPAARCRSLELTMQAMEVSACL